MHFGIIVFPGSNCERDCLHVVQDVLGHSGALVWHESTDLSVFDGILVPGGFAHGDYLRAGAIARFSPVMDSIAEFASFGKPVVGICNGFQILCESKLLPGALTRNTGGHFICRDTYLRVENTANRFLQFGNVGDVIRLPIRHGEGCYYADNLALGDMEANSQILLRYCDAQGTPSPEANPNGSVGNIAGVMNADGTIFGLMPHPEAAAEIQLGNTDGLLIWKSLVEPLLTGRARSQGGNLLSTNVNDLGSRLGELP